MRLFALDSLIFVILDLMLHHNIYRGHKSYKPLEGQKRPALMHVEYRETRGGGGGKEFEAFPFFSGNPYFLMFL